MDHIQFRELALAAVGISAINVGRQGIHDRYWLCIRTGVNIQLSDSQLGSYWLLIVYVSINFFSKSISPLKFL
jgi:hypothetical protein